MCVAAVASFSRIERATASFFLELCPNAKPVAPKTMTVTSKINLIVLLLSNYAVYG